MKIRNVKGCYDFLPNEQKIKDYIINTLKEVFENYGYKNVETPVLCYYDILSDKYDSNNDILKEIYRLKDQGNRDLGLRYDLTVPFAKMIALNKNKIEFPFKRYEIDKVFRNGPIKTGRDREFIQCDIDVVGLNNQVIEAELMSLYVEAFKRLNIDIIIKINSRNLLSGLILESNINEDMIMEVTTIIDKKEKLTKDEFITMLLNIGVSKENINKLLFNLELTLEELNNKYINTNNKFLEIGLNELSNLFNLIKNTEIEKYCEFSPNLARGQNYYTGNIFEVYDKDKVINSSIGGGGRYDKIITNFIADNNEYPAVGISFGLSVIYEIIKNKEIFNSNPTQILIIPVNTEKESLTLANKIRNMKINVDIDMRNKKLKKSLEYADRVKIEYVIVYGEDEVNKKTFKLKNMVTKEETLIDENNIEETLEIMFFYYTLKIK